MESSFFTFNLIYFIHFASYTLHVFLVYTSLSSIKLIDYNSTLYYTYAPMIVDLDELKRELPPPVLTLDELIDVNEWLNIPACLMNAQRHQLQYILNHDDLFK